MLTRNEKIKQLKQWIEKRLRPLIDRPYVLLGLPYYLNVGDILIWEGERQFLKSLPYPCLNEGYHYRDEQRIHRDTLIILQGGGNFGDLWRFIQEERLNIINRYKNNPILITPVTYHYENQDLLKSDVSAFAQHPHLTICARDAVSYERLKNNFTNEVILVPDMAFCLDTKILQKYSRDETKDALFLKRTDKELSEETQILSPKIPSSADVRDWPSMEREPLCWRRFMKLSRYATHLNRSKWGHRLSLPLQKASDSYFHNRCRPWLIREGIHFISSYRKIYSTRLHGAILGLLLNKDVILMDNSYGKNSSFFETWLNDTEGVELWKTD